MNNTTPPTSDGSILIFSCSGAANVGEIADRAARSLMKAGRAKMFCLAGVGGLVPDILERTKAASSLLVIDGCEKDCGRQCLLKAGIGDFRHVRITNLAIEKGKTPVTEQVVAKVAQHAAGLLT